MITYVDTSTLIKLIIEESGSDAAAVIWDQANVLAAARILYVEARAALATARRGGRLTTRQHHDAVASLDALWTQVSIVEISEDLIAKAVDLAEKHPLRGYEAVHLSAAILVGADVLTSADRHLCVAGREEGLHVANPTESADDAPARHTPTAQDLPAQMTKDSGVFGIPVPANVAKPPLPAGGFLAHGIGTIEEVTFFYKDYMSTEGWIFDKKYSVLDPYQSSDEPHIGYITKSFYAKPTIPVTTVGIIVGNADGKPGHKRDLIIYITPTPDDDLPEAALRLT